MENILEYLGGILTVTSVFLFAAKIFATEYITKLVKTIFKSKTDKSANVIFYILITILLVIGIAVFISSYQTDQVSEGEISKQEQVPKTDAEVFLESTEKLTEAIQQGVENHQKKNEELIKKRGSRFVYRIGDIKDNAKSIFILYEKLKKETNIDVSRLYVFKIKRKKFFIYYNTQNSKNQLKNSLDIFKVNINSVEPIVKIIDLHEYCKPKENVEETKSLEERKYKFQIPLCECDK